MINQKLFVSVRFAQAMQWTGDNTADVAAWLGRKCWAKDMHEPGAPAAQRLFIPGEPEEFEIGDWLVQYQTGDATAADQANVLKADGGPLQRLSAAQFERLFKPGDEFADLIGVVGEASAE